MSDANQSLHQLNERIIACERCPRLREHCRAVAEQKRAAYRDWDYWARPVPNLLPTRAAGTDDPSQARLLLVGLAPAAHGANRTGRMFTGDRSGDFLYRALYEAGLASQPEATQPGDGLALYDLAITAALHCAPPANKPTREELSNCYPYLEQIFDALPRLTGVITLGKIGHDAVLRLYKARGYIRVLADHPFAHGALHSFQGSQSSGGEGISSSESTERADPRTTSGQPPAILCTYHPSQQNTFTGRLTPEMLREIFCRAARWLE